MLCYNITNYLTASTIFIFIVTEASLEINTTSLVIGKHLIKSNLFLLFNSPFNILPNSVVSVIANGINKI